MTDDELRAWAVQEWIKQAGNNTPLAKSIRNGKAQGQALKKKHKAMLRSLAAQNGATMRVLRKKQVADALALKEKHAAADAELEQRRWNSLLRHGKPGV